MNKKVLAIVVSLTIFGSFCNYLCAWENEKTHPAISQEAVNGSVLDNYLKTQLGLTQGTGTALLWNFPSDIRDRLREGNAYPDITTRTIPAWIKAGSIIEDEDGHTWPWRPRHHFYDPYRNAGLDNRTDHPYWVGFPVTYPSPFDLTGESSLRWAVLGTAQKDPTVNEQSWNYARQGFYLGLTSNSKSYREVCLAIAFLDLGDVLHLLEDMGVPAHTRNDFLFAHYRSSIDYLNPLEDWAEKQVKANNGNIPSAWLTGWTPQAKVFNKLSRYWDTDSNTIPYIGPTPSSSWGLAEQTNYQFLSTSTVFGCTGTLYQFPQPAESNMTIITETNKKET